MNRQELATRLVQIAEGFIESKGATEKTREGMLRDVREAQVIVAELKGIRVTGRSASRVTIDKLKGFSPQSLRTAINMTVEQRQQSRHLYPAGGGFINFGFSSSRSCRSSRILKTMRRRA